MKIQFGKYFIEVIINFEHYTKNEITFPCSMCKINFQNNIKETQFSLNKLNRNSNIFKPKYFTSQLKSQIKYFFL